MIKVTTVYFEWQWSSRSSGKEKGFPNTCYQRIALKWRFCRSIFVKRVSHILFYIKSVQGSSWYLLLTLTCKNQLPASSCCNSAQLKELALKCARLGKSSRTFVVLVSFSSCMINGTSSALERRTLLLEMSGRLWRAPHGSEEAPPSWQTSHLSSFALTSPGYQFLVHSHHSWVPSGRTSVCSQVQAGRTSRVTDLWLQILVPHQPAPNLEAVVHTPGVTNRMQQRFMKWHTSTLSWESLTHIPWTQGIGKTFLQ